MVLRELCLFGQTFNAVFCANRINSVWLVGVVPGQKTAKK